MKQTNKLLFFIFLATVIPTTIVYGEHAYVEFQAYDNNELKTGTKATKQLAEGILFTAIALGYIILAWIIILAPGYRITYIITIVGTIAVIILWLVRIYGIPIPGTDVVIKDFTMDWRDVVTKTGQVIMLVALTRMLPYRDRPRTS